MNQLDLQLNATMNRSIDLASWDVSSRTLPRGLVVTALAALSWGVLWALARLLF